VSGVIWEVKDPIRLQGERRRAEVTARILRPEPDDIILDVGCGDGYQISYILGRASRIIGIDLSRARLENARKRIRGADLVRASSEQTPFRQQIFDKATCLELLEHLSNPSVTLQEIESILKEDGILVVSVPYRERIISTECIHCGKPTPLWGHIHSFDERKLASLLPRNLRTIHQIYTGTVIAAYPLFSFLPTSIWKLIDDVSRFLPGMKPSWLVSKIRKS
jgi:ubiquinone/menaquinone biosynthesis C-methylase UbiE